MLTEIPSAGTVLDTAMWLESFWRERADTSFDPYDGLETDRFGWFAGLPQVAQFGVVQVNKRAPVNLRPLLGVRKTRNSYAVAHFASACARLAPLAGDADDVLETAMRQRLDWLCATRVDDAWAYPFDVQTKTFVYPKTVPNVICTAFSAMALLDGLAFEAGTGNGVGAAGLGSGAGAGAAGPGSALWPDAVRGAVVFALERLLTRRDGRVYFRYLEAEPLLIHNANVLAARFVARAGIALGEPTWVEEARLSLAVSVAATSPEGLLPYGEGSHEAWVDGHHTGFVAEALLDLATMLDDEDLAKTAARVRRAYRRSLFEGNGRPLLFPGHRFPIDVITGAQGIQTFSKAGGRADVSFACEVAGFMLSHMRTRAGTFKYRKGRIHAKSVPYVRWSDAPMCLSLAYLATALHPTRLAPRRAATLPSSKDNVTA